VIQSFDTEEANWSWEGELSLDDWLIAVGWSDDTQDWVVTAPIWMSPPAQPPRDTAVHTAIPEEETP
jgi:hypothetical protein